MAKEELQQKSEEYVKSVIDVNAFDWKIVREICLAYIAGATENGIHWHKLKENPNDLPKEDCQVITVGKSPRGLLIKKVAYYLRNEKKFTIWNKEYESFNKLHNVVAWCEIPTFDKE